MDKTDTPDPRMRAYLAIDRKDGAEGSHSATAADPAATPCNRGGI